MVPPSVDPLVIVAQMEQQLAVLRQQIARPAAGTAQSRRIDHGNSTDEYRAAHEALKANKEVWQSLSFVGLQHDGDGGLVELRHCPSCQSTLTLAITPSDALYLCELQADLASRSKQAISKASVAKRSPTKNPLGDASARAPSYVRR